MSDMLTLLTVNGLLKRQQYAGLSASGGLPYWVSAWDWLVENCILQWINCQSKCLLHQLHLNSWLSDFGLLKPAYWQNLAPQEGNHNLGLAGWKFILQWIKYQPKCYSASAASDQLPVRFWPAKFCLLGITKDSVCQMLWQYCDNCLSSQEVWIPTSGRHFIFNWTTAHRSETALCSAPLFLAVQSPLSALRHHAVSRSLSRPKMLSSSLRSETPSLCVSLVLTHYTNYRILWLSPNDTFVCMFHQFPTRKERARDYLRPHIYNIIVY